MDADSFSSPSPPSTPPREPPQELQPPSLNALLTFYPLRKVFENMPFDSPTEHYEALVKALKEMEKREEMLRGSTNMGDYVHLAIPNIKGLIEAAMLLLEGMRNAEVVDGTFFSRRSPNYVDVKGYDEEYRIIQELHDGSDVN